MSLGPRPQTDQLLRVSDQIDNALQVLTYVGKPLDTHARLRLEPHGLDTLRVYLEDAARVAKRLLETRS